MDILRTTFARLYGHPCWGVHYDPLLNLSIRFGNPRLSIREPYLTKSRSAFVKRIAAARNVTVKGQWRLWIYCSHWKVVNYGKVVGKSTSSLRKRRIAAATLCGQKLVEAEVHSETGATRFRFDLGAQLDVRRFRRETDDELWLLYKPNGFVLAVRGNGVIEHRPKSAVPNTKDVRTE